MHGTFRVQLLSIAIGGSLYSVEHTLYKKLVCRSEGFVYNIALVRQLCADMCAEKDPVGVSELADLLQAVVKEDQEEIRMRMAFLKRKYADVIEQTKAAD
jgi:uncharacterized protein CbrC (UPF0167 family)